MGTNFEVGDKVRRKMADRDDGLWHKGSQIVTIQKVFSSGTARGNLIFEGLSGVWEAERFEHVGAAVVEDKVNSPLHYNYGKVETIDYIMQVCALYPGHQAALVANVIKYVSRAPMKGDKEKDLKKAQWYLNKLIDSM